MDSEGRHDKLVAVSSANELNFSVCKRWWPSSAFVWGKLFFSFLGHVHIAVVDGVYGVVVVDPGENGCEDATGGTTGSGWRRSPVGLAANQVGDVGQCLCLRLPPPSTALLWADTSRAQDLHTPVTAHELEHSYQTTQHVCSSQYLSQMRIITHYWKDGVSCDFKQCTYVYVCATSKSMLLKSSVTADPIHYTSVQLYW